VSRPLTRSPVRFSPFFWPPVAVDTEAEEFNSALDAIEQRASLLEAALSAAENSPAALEAKKFKHTFEFGEKELDKYGKTMEALKVDIRQLFTQTRLRAVEVGLQNFENSLRTSYQLQGLGGHFPPIVKEARDFFVTVPRNVEWISQTWHHAESKDAETDKITKYEKDFYALTHAYNWLLHRTGTPLPDLAGLFKSLKTTRDAMQEWMTTTPKATLRSLLEAGASTETEVASEQDHEAAAEAAEAAEGESLAETEADADADADEEADEEADAEEEGEAQEDATEGQSMLESRAEAGADAAAAAEAEALFQVDSEESDSVLQALLDAAVSLPGAEAPFNMELAF